MMDMPDSVVLTRDVPESGLSAGDVGAIVHRYAENGAYEVKFVTGEGRTVAVLTLTDQDLRPLGREEILHARRMVSG